MYKFSNRPFLFRPTAICC